MDPIAIVGFSFKLPQGADTVESFWSMLEAGRNVMAEWPKSRINIDAFQSSAGGGLYPLKARGAHFVDGDLGVFDAPFFSITAKEAAAMDPQQRLLLETCYRALENAGLSMSDVARSRTAVFEASFLDDYSRFLSKDAESMPLMTATGTASTMLANRVSWFFDLSGPSMHIDTACSSGMVALDLACQSLHAGTSDMALVTGTNLLLGPEASLLLGRMNFLSPDSVCYSFDERANGYARGEGIVVFAIKRLSDALAHHDMIRAVIRGTGSNQDGRTPGMTQPSGRAQEQLIRDVYARAGLGFHETRFVEAHGTGTPIGDPIEVGAIGRVFRTSRASDDVLYIGSVKANIGHLEGASGLAGVLKAVVMLEKGMIPPNALFKQANPGLDLDFYHIKVPTECLVWPSRGVRRISVNSFGFGGANAHAILDDALSYLQENGLDGHHDTVADPCASHGHNEPVEDGLSAAAPTVNGHKTLPEKSEPSKLLVLSAFDENTLAQVTENHRVYCETRCPDSASKLDRLAHTLSSRRSAMPWRCYAVVRPSPSGISFAASKPSRAGRTGIALIFTGQGTQYAHMGMELAQYAPFRAALARADHALASLGGTWSLFDAIKSEPSMDDAAFSQPLCSALQLALVELLRHVGVMPVAVLGHSSGEIAAAYACGALSFESACKVAYHRGQLAARLSRSGKPAGAMLAASLAEDDVSAYLGRAFPDAAARPSVTVACINSAKNITISGDKSSIEMLESALRRDNIFAQIIRTGVAYHSPAMESIAAQYLELLGSLETGISSRATGISMVSSVTGRRTTREAVSDPLYWVRNLVSPVRFHEALTTLLDTSSSRCQLKSGRTRPVVDLIEVGPHAALRRPCLDTMQRHSRSSEVRYSSVLHRLKPPAEALLNLVGRLFASGYDVSVSNANKTSDGTGFVTDTPEYPFNHAKRYWHESRMSLGYRLQGTVNRGVLGSEAAGWNPLEPKWRKFINVVDMPWVADHAVSRSLVFPATGSIVMALEGVKQVARKERSIAGFLVKEATFQRPIVLRPDTEAGQSVECVVSLGPVLDKHESEPAWFEAWISKHDDGVWTECFRATIKILYGSTTAHAMDDEEVEREHEQAAARRAHDEAELACRSAVPSSGLYQYCKDRGIVYGPSFQILKRIKWNGSNLAVGQVDMDDQTSTYDGLVHPAVLDAACQLFYAPSSKGLTSDMATLVPHRVHNAYFRADSWKGRRPGSSFKIAIDCRGREVGRGVEGSLQLLADDGTLLCSARKMELHPIADDAQRPRPPKKLLYGLEWRPRLSMLTRPHLRAICSSEYETPCADGLVQWRQQLDLAVRECILATASSVSVSDAAPSHVRQYVGWMERQLPNNLAGPRLGAKDLGRVLTALESKRPSWSIFSVVARNLASILRGETDPLALVFSNRLVEDFYLDIAANLGRAADFGAFIDLASHETPQLRILEVGAGTGGFTTHVLAALEEREKRTGATAFSNYLYTDVSPAFFERAKSNFSRFASRMSFRPLDLEVDMAAQGIDLGTYDMVIAAGVLHTTAMIGDTLRNVRKALRPGGQLVVLELTKPGALAINFAFGILPGWWNSKEEWRARAQGADESTWDTLFRDNGFTGNEIVLRDYQEEQCRDFSIIITTADAPPRVVPADSRVVIVTDKERSTSLLATEVREKLEARGYLVDVMAWSDLAGSSADDSTWLVFLVETDRAMLNELAAGDFQLLNQVLQRFRKLLWVSSSSVRDASYAYHGMTDGFLRTIRSESTSAKIVTLVLETGLTNAAHFIDLVFHDVSEAASLEVEFAVQDEQIVIGRLMHEAQLDVDLRSRLEPTEKQETWGEGVPLMFSARVRGTLDSLEYVQDDAYAEHGELGPLEVEVETRAWGVNFRDLFMALGRLEENHHGFDATGIVSRAGSACKVQPGDRVLMIMKGCMRTYARSHELDVIRIPAEIGLIDAVAIAAPGVTAYRALVDTARLQKGERILIHSAAGATGQMAVQMAQWIGAEVFATVGSREKRQFLIDAYRLPAERIFYSRGTSFGQAIMRVTKDQGVHVVLNSLSGEGLRVSWDLVAPHGRFVEIGKMDIRSNSNLPMGKLANNVSFSAVDIAHLYVSRPDVIQQLLQDVMRLLQDGTLRPPRPIHLFNLSQVTEAFRALQSGKQIGRAVIEVRPDQVVKKRTRSSPGWAFSPEHSYLIAGGLGGVGRAVTRWMASRGAKNLVLWARPRRRSQDAHDLIRELAEAGVRVAVIEHDLTSYQACRAGLEECAKSMPAIKGCLNAAMVLQDSIFVNMSHQQWTAALRSKVETSWHLHQLLPRSLDFFVMLSSLSGIYGTISQANYAAGNTFQDALARYRTAAGQKAMSFNLGWMRSVGVIAENRNNHSIRGISSNMAKVETEELTALLDIYCDPDLPVADPAKSQLLVGVLTPSDCQDEGLDVPFSMRKPLFSGFVHSVNQEGLAAQGAVVDTLTLLGQAATAADQNEIIITALGAKLERTLAIPAQDIDVMKPLVEYGVDSLVAVELRNWMAKEFMVDIAVFNIMGGTTIRKIADLVTRDMKKSG